MVQYQSKPLNPVMQALNLDIMKLVIFFAYFFVITNLCLYIANSLYNGRKLSGGVSLNGKHAGRRIAWSKVAVFAALAAGSFGHNYYYVVEYLKWSFQDFENRHNLAHAAPVNPFSGILAWLQGKPSITIRLSEEVPLIQRLSDWLSATALQEQFWTLVSKDALNWWWTQQFCLFTGGFWVLFVYVESRRYSIPHAWMYILLALIGGASISSNLFYVAILIYSSSSSASFPATSPLTLTPSFLVVFPLTVLSTASVPAFVGTEQFSKVLNAMHPPLFLPFSPIALAPKEITIGTLISIYGAIDTASLLLRMLSFADVLGIPIIPSTHPSSISSYLSNLTSSLKSPRLSSALTSLPGEVISTIYSNPAQSKISWDIIWTSASFIIYILLTSHADSIPNTSTPNSKLTPTTPGASNTKSKRAVELVVNTILALASGLACAVFSITTVAPKVIAFIEGWGAEAAGAGTGVKKPSENGSGSGKEKVVAKPSSSSKSKSDRKDWWAGAEGF